MTAIRVWRCDPLATSPVRSSAGMDLGLVLAIFILPQINDDNNYNKIIIIMMMIVLVVECW